MKWTSKHARILIGQLELYAKAGLSLGDAIRALQRTLGRHAAVLERMHAALESGKRLSTVLRDEVYVPSAVFALVESGELSGSMGSSLESARLLMERHDELVKKVFSALAYPAVIGCATLVLTLSLVKVVLPQIIPLLVGLHTELPVLTRLVMWCSLFIMHDGLWCLIAAAACAGAFAWSYRRHACSRCISHKLILHAPIVGGIAKLYAHALFFEGFGAMVQSGMSAIDAYEKSAGTVILMPVRSGLMCKVQPLIRGAPFLCIADDSMPAYAPSLIQAGEKSGTLGAALSKVSLLMTADLDHGLKRMTALLEPALMLGMGTMVGSVALAIMLPIYDVSKTLQH